MIKVKLFLVLLITSFLVVSCEDSFNENNSSSNFTENFGNSTSKDFLGQVVDEDNNPIQNAAIQIGTSTAQTDANGVFIINDASVFEKFAYITAKKAGFIDGSRAVIPTSGTNTVKIMMLSGTVLATVNSGVSSEAVLSNGAKVTFDGNFKTETGTAYSGSVNVIMHHLDPADPNVADKMPGMLFAESADGQAKVLETYGMMNVELRGTAGEKLQITNTAQIEMPITATQLSSAPNTIPLWHFDETLGYWKEEGSAVKQGNKYVGTVSHFSWWNCDNQFPMVNLSVMILDESGNPLSHVGVGISRTGTSQYMTFTNDGQANGMVPANEILTLKIYDVCGSIISSSSIGPFSVDTVLPPLTLTNGATHLSTISGSLNKCDNSPVTNGYVNFKYGNQSIYLPVTNGDFSFTTLVCNSITSFKFKGVDFDNIQSTGVINYNFSFPHTIIGNIMACSAVDEFMSYQIDNNTPVYFIEGNGVSFSDMFHTWDNSFEVFAFTQTGIGMHVSMPSTVGVYESSQINTLKINQGDNLKYSPITIHLNNYGASGEYIDLTFNGTFADSLGNHTLIGNVHVLKY